MPTSTDTWLYDTVCQHVLRSDHWSLCCHDFEELQQANWSTQSPASPNHFLEWTREDDHEIWIHWTTLFHLKAFNEESYDESATTHWASRTVWFWSYQSCRIWTAYGPVYWCVSPRHSPFRRQWVLVWVTNATQDSQGTQGGGTTRQIIPENESRQVQANWLHMSSLDERVIKENEMTTETLTNDMNFVANCNCSCSPPLHRYTVQSCRGKEHWRRH